MDRSSPWGPPRSAFYSISFTILSRGIAMVSFSFSLFSAVAVLAAVVVATPVNNVPTGSPLHVVITPGKDNAVVEIAVTNVGDKDLEILNLGTFLYDAPIEKVDVYYNGERIPFNGLLIHYNFDHLTDSAFTLIRSGQTISRQISLPGLYEFTSTGSYSIEAQGALSFVPVGKRDELPISITTGHPENALAFKSNRIELSIDAVAAGAVETLGKALEKRGMFVKCEGQDKDVMDKAFGNAEKIAKKAAEEAEKGSEARFQEYFKTTDSSVRESVAARFRAMSEAVSSTTENLPKYYCHDPAGECKENIIAYTYPHSNTVANCDIFYKDLPALSTQCYRQDQAGTVIHELAHVPGVYGPYCGDYAYGYTQASKLEADKAIKNADTFALFAKAAWLGCEDKKRGSGGVLPF